MIGDIEKMKKPTQRTNVVISGWSIFFKTLFDAIFCIMLENIEIERIGKHFNKHRKF